jgi:hypothetical protein
MFCEIICFHKGVRILLVEIKHLSANTQKEVAIPPGCPKKAFTRIGTMFVHGLCAFKNKNST